MTGRSLLLTSTAGPPTDGIGTWGILFLIEGFTQLLLVIGFIKAREKERERERTR